MEFWSVIQTVTEVQVYGGGRSMADAHRQAVETLHRLHPGDHDAAVQHKTQLLLAMDTTQPAAYWVRYADNNHKQIVHLQ